MKLNVLLIFAFLFCLAAHGQDSASVSKHQKPKATYQSGEAKVSVWENKRADSTSWKSFKIEKVYMKDGKQKTTDYFDEKELLQLKEAIEKAITGEIKSNNK